MAARRGTSRCSRAAPPGPAPARAFAAVVRPVLAPPRPAPAAGNQTPYWLERADWPVPARTGPDCTPVAGAITLAAALAPKGALDQRDHRFERPDGTSVACRVTPTLPPQVLR